MLEISALLQAGISPSLTDIETLSLPLLVTESTTLSDVIDVLNTVRSQHKYYAKAYKKLLKAQKYNNKGNTDKALKEALKASDYLVKISHADINEVRFLLAKAIRYLEMLKEWPGTDKGNYHD